MPAQPPYDDPQLCGTKAGTEEDPMFSHISLVLADERARDMRSAAARARRRKEARQAWRAAHSPLGWSARHARDISDTHQVPDSYEEFLCQTAQSAMREPTAAGRSHGQAVH
jgi:hypothetical protein